MLTFRAALLLAGVVATLVQPTYSTRYTSLTQRLGQFVWGLQQLAATYPAGSTLAAERAVQAELIRMSRLSSDPQLAECFGRPGGAWDASDAVRGGAARSSGLSQDLVTLKGHFEALTGRARSGRLTASRRALATRLITGGASVADLLFQGLVPAPRGGVNDTTSIVPSSAIRLEAAAWAVAEAVGRYLSCVQEMEEAGRKAVERAALLLRRLNVAVGICLDREASEMEGASDSRPAEGGDAPAFDFKSGRVVPPLEEAGGTFDGWTRSSPVRARAAGSVDTLDAVRTGVALELSLRSLHALVLPREHTAAVCALAGALAAFLPAPTLPEGACAASCTAVVDGTGLWARSLCSGRGPPTQWDCDAPSSHALAPADGRWSVLLRPLPEEGLASCMRDTSCDREPVQEGTTIAVDGLLDLEGGEAPTLVDLWAHVASPLIRLLALVRAEEQQKQLQF